MLMKTKSELRGILFRHLDGIVTVPASYSLHNKGVLDYIFQQKKVSLKELTAKFTANEGYLNVALRVLASQGWLIQYVDNQKNEIYFEKETMNVHNIIVKLTRIVRLPFH